MIAPLVHGILTGLLLTQPASAEPIANELTVGAASFSYDSFARPSPQFIALEVAYERRLGTEGLLHALRVGAGLRATTPAAARVPVPLEGFARLLLSAQLGPWEPSVGPELGVSAFTQLLTPIVFPAFSPLFVGESARLGPVYLAFDLQPLAFHFGRFRVSALELQMGTSLASPSSALRFEVLLARVGVAL